MEHRFITVFTKACKKCIILGKLKNKYLQKELNIYLALILVHVSAA
jgi:hypothetical protein